MRFPTGTAGGGCAKNLPPANFLYAAVNAANQE